MGQAYPLYPSWTIFLMESWPLNLQMKTIWFFFQGSSLLEISDVDLCLSPAGAVGKKNLSSETYVKEDDCDTANMEDFGLKIPIIIETLEMDNGKTVSSIGSSNLVSSHWLYRSFYARKMRVQY